MFGRGRIRFPGLFCGWRGSGSYDPMSSVIGVRKLACTLFAFFRGHAWAAVSSIRVTHVLGLRVRTLMSFVFVFGARKFRFACYLHGLKHVRAALASASSAPKRGGFVVIFEWASELLFRGLRASVLFVWFEAWPGGSGEHCRGREFLGGLVSTRW